MISHLIADYRDIHKRLSDAIGDDDHSAVLDIDRQLVAVVDKIVNYEIRSVEQAIEKLGIVLEIFGSSLSVQSGENDDLHRILSRLLEDVARIPR